MANPIPHIGKFAETMRHASIWIATTDVLTVAVKEKVGSFLVAFTVKEKVGSFLGADLSRGQHPGCTRIVLVCLYI